MPILHKSRQNRPPLVHSVTYVSVKVLDSHVSDNPMLPVSGLAEEAEAHLLPNEPCELFEQYVTHETVPRTSSAIRTDRIIDSQSLIFNTPILLRLFQSACGKFVVLLNIDEFGGQLDLASESFKVAPEDTLGLALTEKNRIQLITLGSIFCEVETSGNSHRDTRGLEPCTANCRRWKQPG